MRTLKYSLLCSLAIACLVVAFTKTASAQVLLRTSNISALCKDRSLSAIKVPCSQFAAQARAVASLSRNKAAVQAFNKASVKLSSLAQAVLRKAKGKLKANQKVTFLSDLKSKSSSGEVIADKQANGALKVGKKFYAKGFLLMPGASRTYVIPEGCTSFSYDASTSAPTIKLNDEFMYGKTFTLMAQQELSLTNETDSPAPVGDAALLCGQRNLKISAIVRPGRISTGAGLTGRYYNGTNFDQLVTTRVDSKISFKWEGSPFAGIDTDRFSIRWTGFLEAPETGQYTIISRSDDGVRLFLGDEELISDWKQYSEKQNTTTVQLTAGHRYAIRFEFHDVIGLATVKLLWKRPNRTLELIPTHYLYPLEGGEPNPNPPVGPTRVPTMAPTIPPTVVPPTPSGSGTGLTGQYFNGTEFNQAVTSRVDPIINFNFGEGSPASGVSQDNFSIRWTGHVKAPVSGTYTFTTASDDGVRLFVGEQQIISEWNPHAEKLNSAQMNLVAGQKYFVRLEYYDASVLAVMKLFWQTPGGSMEIIPAQYLYPSSGGTTPPVPVPPTATPTVVAPTPRPTIVAPPPGGGGGVTPVNCGNPSKIVNPGQSIQSVVNSAGAGETILIKNGTYNGDVTINNGQSGRPVTLCGESKSGVAIQGFVTGNANVAVKNLTVKNVRNGPQNNEACVKTSSNWLLEDIIVENCTGTGVGVFGNDIKVIRPIIRNNGTNGIGGWDSTNVLLQDGVVYRNNRGTQNPPWAGHHAARNINGLYYFDPSWEGGGGKWMVTNNLVIDNMNYCENGGPGVWLDAYNKNYTVQKVEAFGQIGFKFPSDGEDKSWAGMGISIELNDGGMVRENFAHDNQGSGIAIQESEGVNVERNIFLDDEFELRALGGRERQIGNIMATQNRFLRSIPRWSVTDSRGSNIALRNNVYSSQSELNQGNGMGEQGGSVGSVVQPWSKSSCGELPNPSR